MKITKPRTGRSTVTFGEGDAPFVIRHSSFVIFRCVLPFRRVLLVPLLLLTPVALFASPSGALREYNAGQYDESLKEYEQLLQRHADDPRLHFNAGAAAYRGRRFDEAAKQFNEALASPDVKLQEHAYYNLGNTLYQLGARNPDPTKRIETWENSLKGYDSTLKLNPQDADAKFNYEFVKKKLEELKQQRQQQQQNKSDEKKDQDQQQQKQNQDEKKDQEQKKDQQSQQQKQDEKDKQQQQASNQSKEQQEKERQQKEQQAKQQQANQSSPQSKQKPDEKDQSQPAQNYAAAQMTPEQAQQLLDAQKGDEAVLPMKPTEKPKQSNRPIKDW